MRVAVPNFYVDPHDAHDVMQKIISEDARIPATMADVVLYPLITCSNFGDDRIDMLKRILCHTSVISIAHDGIDPSYTTYVIEDYSVRISSSFEVDGAKLSVVYAPDGTAILKTSHQAPFITQGFDTTHAQALEDLARALDVEPSHSYEALNNLTSDDLVGLRINNADEDDDDLETDDMDETAHIAGMMYVSSDGSADDIAKHISEAIRKIQEENGLDVDITDAMNVEMIAEPLDMNGNPMSADDIPDAIKKQIEEVKRALSQQGVSFEVNDSIGLGQSQGVSDDEHSIDTMLSMPAFQPYGYDPVTKQVRMPSLEEQIEYLTAKLHAYTKVSKPDFYIMDTALKDADAHAHIHNETKKQAQARLMFILGYVLDLMHTRALMTKHIKQSRAKHTSTSQIEHTPSAQDVDTSDSNSLETSISHPSASESEHQVKKSEALKQFEADLLKDTHMSHVPCPYSYN